MIEVDYTEIDPNIAGLVRMINDFPGVFTTESCGGHQDNKPYQQPAGSWQILLSLKTVDNVPTEEAWTSIELIAFVSTKITDGTFVRVVAADPFLNGFGESLSFLVEGQIDPETYSRQLKFVLEEFSKCQEE